MQFIFNEKCIVMEGIATAVAEGERGSAWRTQRAVSKWPSADLQSGNQMSSPHLERLSKQNLQVSLKSGSRLAPESLARTWFSYSQSREGCLPPW